MPPVTLLIRILTGVLFWRVAAARRRAAAGGPVQARTPLRFPVAQRVRQVRETASLLSRVAVAVGFGTAFVLCFAGGTSSVILSPRWLGGVLLAAAAVFAVLTVREALLARALVKTRRLRERDRRLRGEV